MLEEVVGDHSAGEGVGGTIVLEEVVGEPQC